MSASAIVLGGGVIGLSCARALAVRGMRTTVFEAAPAAREASWAAAGILGAASEHERDGPLFRLGLDALARWPAAAAHLEEESGRAVGFADDGTLVVAHDAPGVRGLEERAAFLARCGVRADPLGPREALALEPALAPDLLGALRLREARIDARALWRAYEAACRVRGVEMRFSERVLELVRAGERVVGARTAHGEVRADAVVVATGAWSEPIAATVGVPLPTAPVKGQMLRVRAAPGHLTRVVKSGPHYVVPLCDGTWILGTTSEDAGFDRSLDEATLASISAACGRLVPAAATSPRAESYAGLRPRLRDGWPAIGGVAGRSGLFLATGHHRNGVLLCDLTGALVADAVLGSPDPRLLPFSPDRFAATPAVS